MSVQPVGIYATPSRRIEAVFQQPRRFPEYLRLQNIRDRVDVSQGIAAGSGTRVAMDPTVPDARDATLARIGEIRPVDDASCSDVAEQCSSACDQASRGAMIPVDGLGRMIDVIA